MQIVSRDNLHEMWKPNFWKKTMREIINILSAAELESGKVNNNVDAKL